LPGATFDDVVRIELRDIHAALHMEQIRAFLPLSHWWLEHRLGISEPQELMLIEADQDLPPEIRTQDLLLVDRSAGNKLLIDGWSAKLFFEGRKCSGTWALEGSNTVNAINFSVRASGCFHDCFAGSAPRRSSWPDSSNDSPASFSIRMPDARDNLVHRPASPR
jgi:hypothetical protein